RSRASPARRRCVGADSPRPAARARPRRARHSRAAHRGARRRAGAPVIAATDVRSGADAILDEVERVVVGKRDALELLLLGILSDGHVLIEDFPGLAKTLIARSFAQSMSLRFSRIQFTPDLMPSDVTGSSIFDQRRSDFEFRPGPIFANLLLADEINRAPPKTQAALLEAMQERQVTIEGATHPLEPPFIVLATQNPIEYEGTYPLPEAQLDRFLLRIGVGYPERDAEIEMLERRIHREQDELALRPVLSAPQLIDLQRALERVHVAEPIRGAAAARIRGARGRRARRRTRERQDRARRARDAVRTRRGGHVGARRRAAARRSDLAHARACTRRRRRDGTDRARVGDGRSS